MEEQRKSDEEKKQSELKKEWKRGRNGKHFPPLNSRFAKESKLEAFHRIVGLVGEQFMEPLLDKDPDGSSDQCDEKTGYPEGVYNDSYPGLLEGRCREIRDGRVDKVSVDCKMGDLCRELHKDVVGQILGLLL